ncbi:MAG: hypothetical protein ACD_2C00091G0004 [uncultured bacterium (gcode 4)]|uniref:Caib/baif family protein n=1 Tax=uncultured bacterium (gcode 4) TaxID=1234023 RepID=K2G3K4_9BACT|nr:MAG: hypothetical protein ACD_2C00091G0004 [uncultured bacterium (gcode 4)]
METIIETKTCSCWEIFSITQEDLDFLEKVSPIIKWERLSIPTPEQCPDCRNRRRLSFRNERNIYKRNCDATWKTILSVFSPDKEYKVYEHSIWSWDSWDATEYWKDFDFSKSFFEQFDELAHIVPHQSIFNVNCENSDYSQLINWKNCYLTFVGWNAEDTLYSHWMVDTKDSIDCLRCKDVTGCYDCVHCYENCYQLKWCFNCKSSSDSAFCFNMIWCRDCFMSSNLINKQYVFKNEQLSKEEYESELKKAHIWENYHDLRNEMVKNMKNWIHRENQNFKSEDCSWDFIKNSEKSVNCYEVSDTRNCKNFFDNAWNCTNCHDATYGWKSENCYEVLGADWVHNIFWMLNIIWTDYSVYAFACYNSNNIFWCISLNNKQYCILNKQYSKEEYEELVPKIIEHMRKTGEWWEFFPASISPFWYNESAAQDHYPLNQSEASDLWFKWSAFENPKPDVAKIIPGWKLPINIADVPDDILNWAIECEKSKKPFRIIKKELDFYRSNGLPIPRLHPDERHKERLELRNPRKLHDRNCDKCWTDIRTTFAPGWSEMIYCEKCYDSEVL